MFPAALLLENELDPLDVMDEEVKPPFVPMFFMYPKAWEVVNETVADPAFVDQLADMENPALCDADADVNVEMRLLLALESTLLRRVALYV